jgi:hypothetical protein
MSRDLYVSALDLAQLRAIQGSGDQALLNRVLEKNRGRIAIHDEYFRNFPCVVQYTPLAEAIGQIVRGQVDQDLTPRFQFEHGAALLADSLGEPLEAGLFAECAPAFWAEVDTVICRRLVLAGRAMAAWPALADVLKRGPYLDVPLDPIWRLGSGYLTTGELRAAASAAEACNLEDPDTDCEDLRWPDAALEAAAQYRGWLHHAAERGAGLFFHA